MFGATTSTFIEDEDDDAVVVVVINNVVVVVVVEVIVVVDDVVVDDVSVFVTLSVCIAFYRRKRISLFLFLKILYKHFQDKEKLVPHLQILRNQQLDSET